jgi:hypothetical protein
MTSTQLTVQINSRAHCIHGSDYLSQSQTFPGAGGLTELPCGHAVPWKDDTDVYNSNRVLHDRMYHGVHLLVINYQQYAGNCAPKSKQPLMSQLWLMIHRWLVQRLS